jgi:hypothetical protein
MNCYYCNEKLSVDEYSHIDLLTVCCNPQQSFCFKCLFDRKCWLYVASLVEQSVFEKSPFLCVTCSRNIPP